MKKSRNAPALLIFVDMSMSCLDGELLTQMCQHYFLRLVAKLVGGKLCDGVRVENLVNDQLCFGGTQGEILHYALGALYGGDHNGNLCALGNFESTAAEGQHIAVSGAGAFGINAHGGYVLLDKLGGLENGFQRLAIVFAVNGHGEITGEQLLGYRNLENTKGGK